MTLLPLNTPRHFGSIKTGLNDEIPFKMKISKAIWRGSTTGSSNCWYLSNGTNIVPDCPRSNLIAKWGNVNSTRLDIGLSQLVQDDYNMLTSVYSSYLKPNLDIKDMLLYRYLISVEGNDVATNLKWSMASNSIVLMPIPRVETFFGEGLLKPWVHFIPLRSDTSDLLEKIEFCEENLEICEKIAKKSRIYVSEFQDIERIRNMSIPVLKTHLDSVYQLSVVRDRHNETYQIES